MYVIELSATVAMTVSTDGGRVCVADADTDVPTNVLFGPSGGLTQCATKSDGMVADGVAVAKYGVSSASVKDGVTDTVIPFTIEVPVANNPVGLPLLSAV